MHVGPWYEHASGVTYPAHGAEALVDPLVPLAGSRVLVFGGQSFVTSVEICREKEETSEQEINSSDPQHGYLSERDVTLLQF